MTRFFILFLAFVWVINQGCRTPSNQNPEATTLPPTSTPHELTPIPTPTPTPQATLPPHATQDDDSKFQGGLTRDEILGVIRTHMPQVLTCFETTLKKSDVKGQRMVVAVYFKIGKDGLVTKSEIERSRTTLDHPKLHECMKKVVASFVFPAPRGGGVVNVTFPFIFIPLKE